MKSFFRECVENHSKLVMVILYNFVTLLVILVFYPLIPLLMGYVPGFLEVTKAVGASYNTQYLFVAIFTLVVGTIIFTFSFKGIGEWKNLAEAVEPNEEKLKNVRIKCINLPYLIFMGQMTVVSVPLLIVFVIIYNLTHAPIIVMIRLFTIIFSLFSLAGVFSHAFSKRLFTKILLKTYKGQELEGIRINLKGKILLQVIPLLIISILFTGLLGYTRLIEEKGDQIYELVKLKMQEQIRIKQVVSNEEEIWSLMDNIELKNADKTVFIVTPENEIITSTGEVFSSHLKYFIEHPLEGDRIYGDTTEQQGVIMKVDIAGKMYIVGLKFELGSHKMVNSIMISFMALLLINILILYYFTKTLADEIKVVADGLTSIAEGEEVELDRKLAVISNDEMGDLVVAFNKIQEREKQHVENINKNHEIMMEQERFSSLGQLIGGIAHNLRTPIMSIAGAVEGLKNLIDEYKQSIGNKQVTNDDHKEIADEMLQWANKINPYCHYMSEILTAVKEQTTISNSMEFYFTIKELLRNIELLTEHEVRKNKCKLSKYFNVDYDVVLRGDMGSLIQVINNLIVNSVQAYEDQGGEVDLVVEMQGEDMIFIVRDYAKGINADIQDRLFKEMVTTKGKNGTGLGLYMSNSSIKAKFGGKMWLDSVEGKGTAIYTLIPADHIHGQNINHICDQD